MGFLTLYLSANRVDLEYLLTHTYTPFHTHIHTLPHTHAHVTHTHLKFLLSSTSTPTSRLGVSRSSCGRTRTCRAIGSASCRYSCGYWNNNNRIIVYVVMHRECYATSVSFSSLFIFNKALSTCIYGTCYSKEFHPPDSDSFRRQWHHQSLRSRRANCPGASRFVRSNPDRLHWIYTGSLHLYENIYITIIVYNHKRFVPRKVGGGFILGLILNWPGALYILTKQQWWYFDDTISHPKVAYDFTLSTRYNLLRVSSTAVCNRKTQCGLGRHLFK